MAPVFLLLTFFAHSAFGFKIASGDDNGSILLWNLDEYALPYDSIKIFDDGEAGVRALEYSPNGERLAIGVGLGVQVYDVTGKPQRVWAVGGLSSIVYSVRWSYDGKYLITGEYPYCRVEIWDAENGVSIYGVNPSRYTALYFGVHDVDWNTDYSSFLSCATFVEVWQTDKPGPPTLRMGSEADPALSARFSLDTGARIASGHTSGLVAIWSGFSGGRLYSMTEHTASVVAICYSPDSKQIASASWDGSIKFWDAMYGGRSQMTLYSADVDD